MFTINEKIKSIKDTRVTVPSGIQMAFENGNTISIQFGFGNYSDNYFESKPTANTAEIAIWDKDNKWYEFPDSMGTVKGYCNSDEVAKWIHFAATNIF